MRINHHILWRLADSVNLAATSWDEIYTLGLKVGGTAV